MERLARLVLRSLRNDYKALTYCKWKGHTISEDALARVRNDNTCETEAECRDCGWPVVVRKDADNTAWVSED